MVKIVHLTTKWLSALSLSVVCHGLLAAPAVHKDTHSTKIQPATPPAPIIVEARLPPKPPEEIAAEARDRAEREANDRETAKTNQRLIELGVVQAIVFLLQLGVFAYQAYKLRQTVDVAARQSTDMQNSIRESARAATAIEALGVSVAASARTAAESVATLKERTALQMRPYLSVIIGSAAYQERDKNIKFAAHPTLINAGNTPARNVSYAASAAILPVPVPQGFVWPPVSAPEAGADMGPHETRILSAIVPDFVADEDVESIKLSRDRALFVWGIVRYTDVFGDEHHTEFSQNLLWLSDKIMGYYTLGRNRAT